MSVVRFKEFMRPFLISGVLLVSGTLAVRGQDPIPLTRLSGPIELDGVVDEPAWDDVSPFPMTMFTPTFQAPLTERTEIRVAYDDEYVYLAGRLYDSEPGGVRANTLYRDQYSGDDVLAIVLDTYNDNETAVWFATSPTGTRSDRSVANDGQFGGGVPFGPGGPINGMGAGPHPIDETFGAHRSGRGR